MALIPLASKGNFIHELAERVKSAFVSLIEGGRFVPTYARVVSSTPQHIRDRAGA